MAIAFKDSYYGNSQNVKKILLWDANETQTVYRSKACAGDGDLTDLERQFIYSLFAYDKNFQDSNVSQDKSGVAYDALKFNNRITNLSSEDLSGFFEYHGLSENQKKEALAILNDAAYEIGQTNLTIWGTGPTHK